MPFSLIRQQLLGRGYWNEADDGTGSAGGAGGSDNGGDDGAGEAGDASDGANTGDSNSDVNSGDKSNKPSETEAALLKENMKRKQQNKELQAQIEQLTGQLKQFEGIDLQQVQKLINDQKEAERAKLEEKGQWDALKKQMLEDHTKSLNEVKSTLTEKDSIIAKQQAIIDKLTMGNAFGNSKFIQSEMNLSPEKARIIYGAHFEVEGDKVVAYDKPKGYENRVQLIDGSGEPLSFDEAIKKLVEFDPDKDTLLKPKQKPGAASGTAGLKAPQASVKLTGVSKIEAALSSVKK